MKACGVSRAEKEVTLLELPEPSSPEPGQILVAVEAAGVGPWDELVIDASWDVGLRPPAALGVEGAGKVLAVGAGVTGFAVGDRVLAHEAPLPGGSGFWAERVLINADHAAACPPGLDAAHAAALPVNGLTALQALEKLDLSRGQRLLITNGGGGTTGAAATAGVNERDRGTGDADCRGTASSAPYPARAASSRSRSCSSGWIRPSRAGGTSPASAKSTLRRHKRRIREMQPDSLDVTGFV